jgi:23S rRNA (adenine2503-C2)-methyltransferase
MPSSARSFFQEDDIIFSIDQNSLAAMMLHLKDHTSEELYALLAPVGLKPAAARWIQAAVVRRAEYPQPRPGLSAAVLEEVRSHTSIPHLTLVDKRVSARDGFAKYLFRGDGEESFEAVRIPLLHRKDDPKYVVCVSSQVGCAMGCAFCATGRLGFRRNLSTWEIVDQVLKIRADSSHPLGGVVFMGMGEPMLNYDAVIRAARILAEPCGAAIAAKAITISTAGIVPGIRRFTTEGHNFRLVVSLNAAEPVLRQSLMPVEKLHSLPELIEAIRDYHRATSRRVTLAWTMIAGVNTREEDARRLAELLRGLPVKLDLIDVNDPMGRYRAPDREELDRFRDALRAHLGAPVARRYSGGSDIRAACGMLAGEG